MSSSRVPASPSGAAGSLQANELPDELSEPFFKGLGVVYVEVDDDSGGVGRCDLCAFARKHPAPPPDDPNSKIDTDMRWGVLHNVMDDETLCHQPEEDQHAFHTKCIRAFVLARKAHFREKPGCPVCDHHIIDRSKIKPDEPKATKKKEEKKDGDEDDDDAFGDDDGELEEVGQTGGKKRKRDKQMYSVWIHVRQATGLKLVKSDKTMNPVAYCTVFGKTVNTARGDGGKTYNCVWNESFSFQKMMDEEEFSNETIQIRIEDHTKLWSNTLIGFVKFQADHVHMQPNHEFYQLSYPIVNVASKKKDHAVTMQGQLEVSVCVLSEEDMKEDPNLPIHIYDAEVEMWAELQQKQEVIDFDINKKYLQNNLDLKKEQDLARTSTLFDIVHVKVYKAEDLPKLDKLGSGWVDAFIELEYKGLMASGTKLKSKPVLKSGNPSWNMEFTIPIVNGAPLVYNGFELVVKNHNTLQSNDWIGKCEVNISDILALQADAPPMWKSLYQDIDGKAPTYRGRVLVEFSVERECKDAKMFAQPCTPCREDLVPISGSYRLDFECLEGSHLLENYNEYQVDVTIGHNLTGGSEGREREAGGKCWATFESDSKLIGKGANPTIVPFLTKKSMILHNLPYPRHYDLAQASNTASASGSLPETTPSSPTGTVKPPLDSNGQTCGFTGDATNLAFNSIAENFNNNTCLLDYKSMLPDLIIYVSKKGDRKACVGYLRIPLNNLKRPTENWEHGEDLTVYNVWDKDNSARCLPLKPLVELYHLTSGFLLFKANLTPVRGNAASPIEPQLASTRLEPVPRRKYKLVANVYQAKEMASVDPSGLSSPFATVQIGDCVLKTKPRIQTCFPLWFEALSASVELPTNLLYAPDFAITCYHYKNSLFKFNDPSIFMGRADVPAHVASMTMDSSPPAWYPLQFEEHQYGNILLSFRLTPEDKIFGGIDVVQSGIQHLVDGWESYAVEVSALDIRGKMATKHKMKKIDPIYQIECWDDIQNYTASKIAGDKFTVYLRKPSNPVFYSSINFRIYEGKDLTGVTSIPVSKVLRSGMSWYKLMELILREESMTVKRVIRKWRAFLKKKKFIDPRTIRKARPPSIDEHDAIDIGGEDGAFEAGSSQGIPQSSSRFDYLKQRDQDGASSSNAKKGKKGAPSEKTSLTSAPSSGGNYSSADTFTISIDDPESLASGKPGAISIEPAMSDEVLAAASKPRQTDAEGNEVFEEKDLRYLQCEQLPNRDAGNPFELHWRVGCEYEMLPLVNDPFCENELFVGKDEIHSTFLDKLFARSKHSVGKLRAHFYGYRIGKIPKPGEKEAGQIARVNPLFDAQKYFNPAEYCVRVYILRGLQLHASKGKASGCDPFVTVSMAGGESQKSTILDGTVNPQWYQVFDFNKVSFPAIDSSLTIAVSNDNTLLSSELIGQTEISLENRLFSKIWSAGQKPIERRALKKSKTGRLPQGFIEVVVQILPMSEAGNRFLDYLLSPPKRIPWELRVTLLNCRKVTMKKIYKKSDDCCCYDLCAPPNQSDIKLIAGMSGSKQLPQSTDTHPRSIDGDGMFNWRCIFDLELPAPQMLCNLKLQVWNINWNPDDCIAEAIIPLWGFFELARRELEKSKNDPDKWVRTIPRQWVHLTHPQNSDVGDIEVEIELLPKEVAGKELYKASKGEDGFKAESNSSHYVLPRPNRPDDSFPWYRLDLQILWRCKYMWKKLRWYILLLSLIALGCLVAFMILHKEGFL